MRRNMRQVAFDGKAFNHWMITRTKNEGFMGGSPS
jgi:hypothetical protein